MILVLVFGGIFVMLMGSLTGYILVQKRSQFASESKERALQIAEAGLDYYKWFLAHYPDDLQDGTGVAGPYVHSYSDPEGGTIGQFSLDISGNSQCDVVNAVEITSTGSDNINPTYTRVVYGKYSRPSVAEYAYILNSNVWAGADRTITGPYHSNGGIRMDGTNNSVVSSGVSNWLCTSSFGCSPDSTENGVFGAGPNSALWKYPVPPVDFTGITIDLVNMKSIANSEGLYFNPFGGNPEQKGYHMIFKADGTVDVYKVLNTDWVWAEHASDFAWHQDYELITNENFMGNYVIPPDCGLIFASAKLWIEGVISNKVTVVAANVQNPGIDLGMILSGDITYTAYDGSVGLTAIAEDYVNIPLLSPDDMVLNGIFIAQLGSFGRNYYTTSGSHDVPSMYDSYVKRNTLTINGSIVSNGRVGTKWTSGGVFKSGYDTRVNTYDRKLAIDPPPMTPYTSNDYRFIEWLELK